MLRPHLYQLVSFHFFLLHLLLSFLVTATPQQQHHNPAPHDINAAQRACAELQTQLGGSRIQTPSSPNPEYRNVATGAWNRFNALSEPACVALPLSSGDVQVVMKSIFKYSVKYAVQAGGHSAGAGWGSVDGGIVISFMNMRSVSYDPVRDVVTLQPGIRWGEALQELEPSGVAVLGGRLGNIGTGLLLGGGLSYLGNAHGFSVDALEEADVVLVSGEMVTATATNRYSDLFKALKGGANRFGIVTRYVVRTVHVGRSTEKGFYGGTIYAGTVVVVLVLRLGRTPPGAIVILPSQRDMKTSLLISSPPL
ncbi:hypothetical protein D9611_010184 [Ephemerocybe angulata]|uniref:FAD-binding PCMH-type domain-containing protein n=1 Tax=Ephemerocybe angulata TaxID=980116 RepID=A0A8H5B091_9AGAR|nr:hypothetical protein D9611_010184 [Tulosesus angulatus]